MLSICFQLEDGCFSRAASLQLLFLPFPLYLLFALNVYFEYKYLIESSIGRLTKNEPEFKCFIMANS